MLPILPCASPHSHEVIVVLHRLRGRYREHIALFRKLETDMRLHPWSVMVHYRASTETAVFTWRFDPRAMTALALSHITQAVLAEGGTVIDVPSTARTRRVQLEGLLNSCRLFVPEAPTATAGLLALAASLGLDTSADGSGEEPAGGATSVHFERSGSWQVARLCRADAGEVYIATCAPPRHGDTVEIELRSGGFTARTSVLVTEVTPPHLAGTARIPGFGAKITAGTPALAQILASARKQLGTVKPPLRRRDARYPLKWPVALTAHDGSARPCSTLALDISQRGLFVAASLRLPMRTIVDLALPADDDTGAPLCAQARVVRAIGPDVARLQGLSPGVGVRLVGLGAGENSARFDEFVRRVGQRAQRRIVVGAAPGRMHDLMSTLGGAGYSVFGGTSALAVLSRTDQTRLPPDLVVVDESLRTSDPGGMGQLTRRLADGRLVSFELTGEQSAARARAMADEALVSAAPTG